MKKILFGLLILISVNSFSQNPPNYQYRNVFERSKAAMLDTALHLPRYNTTPSGLRTGASRNSGAVAIDTINHTGFFYSGEKWRNFGSQSFETKLMNGGIVTWDSLLIFAVSPAIYQINGAFYTSTETHLTLDAAHATLNRIDLIYLDSTGAHKLSGTAAATPAEPNLPPNAIRLTAIQVDALVTAPNTVDTLIIYDENVEWVGAATSVTTNFAGASNVCHFVKTTDLGAVTSASYIEYTATSTIKISKYTVLKFNLTLKAAFAANTQMQISWRRAGVLKSTAINIANGNYGYSRTASGCQNITIPLSAWSFLTDSIDGLRIAFTGSNASGAYIDWIQLQEGITQNQPGVGQRFGVSGEDAIASQNRYFNGKDTYFLHIDSLFNFKVTANNYIMDRIAYNSSAAIVALGVDTTNGFIYRKTAGGGAGTINSGSTGKPAYYVGATTLDDFAPIDYATSGTHQLITAAAATDVPLNIKGAGSQSANLLNISSSAGTGDLAYFSSVGNLLVPSGSTTVRSIMLGGTGVVGFGSVAGTRLAIFDGDHGYGANFGGYGLIFKSTTNSKIAFGNNNDFGTTNFATIKATVDQTLILSRETKANMTFKVDDNTGTDATGFNLTAQSGAGTGSNTSAGDIIFQTPDAGVSGTTVQSFTDKLRILRTGGLTMPEIAAPATPASGYTSIYPKSDGLWYGKDDAGVETALSNSAAGVTTMAAIGAVPNANGASISGSTLTLQPADGSFGGVVTTGTQTFAGNKTFNGLIVMSGAGGPRLEVSTSSTGFANRAGRFVRFPATSTGVETALTLERQNNSGNGADLIGIALDFINEAADGNHYESSSLKSVYRNATSRNTQFSITNVINGNTDTSITVGDYVTLTESSATTFTSTSIGNSKIQGGEILVTVEANDATDFQSRTLRFIWSAVNKAGTLTITISTPEEVVALSTGTLAVTITAVDATAGLLQFKANAVSSLTQTTLRASYQTFKNF